MEQLLTTYPNDLRFVYRHYPLIGSPESPFHDKASLATQASEAAGKQGKFWEMHDVLFDYQSQWSELSVTYFQQWLIQQAGELGLDVEMFTLDLTSEELVNQAQNAWDTGQKFGLTGTPSLLINGQAWPMNVPMNDSNFSTIIRLTLLENLQFTECLL